MPTVTKIPATVKREKSAPAESFKKQRVAAYARVSTDHEDQHNSYEAQCDYYRRFITGNGAWEFAGIYADEGISGTSTKKREGFNRMVEDALAGRIDLILTKSVSRFARNTVDSLTTIRRLKERGVEVYFEKENIRTFDARGELLISIMSSLAQEESRSISQNVTWGQRKRFADGRATVPFSRFLGYDRGENGELVINPEEAETVRLIYGEFLSGLSYTAIAKKLTGLGVMTPAGGRIWRAGTVGSILTNEKYKGCALLQKSYTADYLTKKLVPNDGAVPQYYVEDSHPAVIEPAVFDLVQERIRKRRATEGFSGKTIFSSKLRCGCCGAWYGPKVWHSTDRYRRIVWQCNARYGDGRRCASKRLTEEELRSAFVRLVNRLADREALLADLCEIRDALTGDGARELDAGIRRGELDRFIGTVEESDGAVTEFDEAMWSALVDFITVDGQGGMTFTLEDGTETGA